MAGAYNDAGSGTVWYVWNTAITSSSVTWSNWCGSSSGTSVTTNDTVWYVWNGGTCVSDGIVHQQPWQGLTKEQVAANLASQEAAEAAAAERARVAAEASARAEALLLDGLTDLQRAQLVAHRYFDVRGRSGQQYRIKAGMGKHGNVFEMGDDGRLVKSLCCAPAAEIPEADALLAQKLYLEHDEEVFRRTANFRNV